MANQMPLLHSPQSSEALTLSSTNQLGSLELGHCYPQPDCCCCCYCCAAAAAAADVGAAAAAAAVDAAVAGAAAAAASPAAAACFGRCCK